MLIPKVYKFRVAAMSENQPEELTKFSPHTVLKLVPGFILVTILTALAIYISNIPWFIDMGLGVLALAILLGIIIGNTLYPFLRSSCDKGIHFSKRVMMLAPFLLLLSGYVRRIDVKNNSNSQEKSPITIPWFAVFFIVTACVNSLHLLPESIINYIIAADTVMLAVAMVALGLTTHISAIRQAGVK
ncbi:conserved membrane hypothetical protein [Xenorhabdus nematophila F1]|nr:conserved membrane hypothetical protein [Xenorhabdus nematophila F1]